MKPTWFAASQAERLEWAGLAAAAGAEAAAEAAEALGRATLAPPGAAGRLDAEDDEAVLARELLLRQQTPAVEQRRGGAQAGRAGRPRVAVRLQIALPVPGRPCSTTTSSSNHNFFTLHHSNR